MFQLQNRYQDSGWETLDREQFSRLDKAKKRAHKLSKNAISYGMVRVINLANNSVEVEYPAGG